MSIMKKHKEIEFNHEAYFVFNENFADRFLKELEHRFTYHREFKQLDEIIDDLYRKLRSY